MARKSNVKKYVDGIPLKEYILKSLVYKSHRELIKCDTFRNKTGITTLGTLGDYASSRKYCIGIEDVYNYGIDTFMIMPTTTYKQWLLDTGRKNMVGAKKRIPKGGMNKRNALIAIGEGIGLQFDTTMTESDMEELVLEFIDKDEYNSMLDEHSKRG